MKKKYKETIQILISKSFPLLKDKKICVLVTYFRFFACSLWIPPYLRIIVLSKRIVNLENSAVAGLLAHELCHQERYSEMGVVKYFGFAVRYLTSRNARIAEENATDRLTIEKGYGRELYILSEIAYNDRKHKGIKEYYLSLDEIKSYSESLGKW